MSEIEHKDIVTETVAQEGGIHIPHSFEVANEAELIALTPNLKDINKLIYRTDNEWYYRIKNNDPYVYQQITGGEFPNSVGEQTELTGIVSLEDIVSLNADISLLDIIAFPYWIQGKKYFYAGGTGIEPTIEDGDSSTYVGIDSSGIIYSDNKFTEAETLTILPLARMQAVSGQSGQGSDLQTPIHLVWTETQEGHEMRAWLESTVGVLYQEGGLYSENATTPLQVDQSLGGFHNAQRKHIDINAVANIEASSIYHTSGIAFPHNRETLVIPKYWDDGTDIVALTANKYVSHTLLRSPKEEDLFFFVYGTREYDSQQSAQDAKPDYSLFLNQSETGLYPVARFIVRGDSTNIVAVMDERPSIILQKENTGTEIKINSYACTHIDTPAETTITTAGVFVKVAGLTGEVTSSADIVVSTNRFTYTGEATRRFKLDIVASLTSTNNNQVVRGRFAVNGTTIQASEQEKTGVGTNVGTLPLSCMPELSQNDYIEFWIANTSGTGNLQANYMNMNILSVD